MKVALDANTYSDWKRGLRWGSETSKAERVYVSATVFGELCYGFACGAREFVNLAHLENFVAAPQVNLVSAGGETARLYARLKKHLRKEGTPLPENDIWIAASAMEHGATLLTRDRHFDKLPQVSVRFPDR